MNELRRDCGRLSSERIDAQACFSQSQLYRWRRGEQLERKERAVQLLPEKTVENAARTVATFPHFGGRKGQAYMDYHEKGHLGQKQYEKVKRNVRRLFMQEVDRRRLFPARGFYDHIRPQRVGEIWAEDFTELAVEGCTFKVPVVLDVYNQYYLGATAGQRATAELVARPVKQALEATGGRGPEQFLLSDNGTQYISEAHNRLLTSAQIVHRLIPACVPQYNGTAEGSMRELKSVFYNLWERRKREGADEGKSLLERVQAAVAETVTLLNEGIPRPCLGGVTPADVQFGRTEATKARIREYREMEEARRDVSPWRRNYWEVLRTGLGMAAMSDGELLTKAAFFTRKPLRRIAQLNRGSVG